MNRRAFLKAIGSAALLPMLRRLWASTRVRRVRPTDVAWPSQTAWKQLNEAVGGNLFPVNFPLSILKTDPDGVEAQQLGKNIRNPYYLGDPPGLTQTDGWLDRMGHPAERIRGRRKKRPGHRRGRQFRPGK